MKKAILFIATLFNHCTYLKHIQSKFAYRDSYRCYYSHRDIAMLSCRSNKSLIIAILCFSLILVSCGDESNDIPDATDYTVAEAQLRSDYNTYNIGTITWLTQRGYQIGKFAATEKSQSQSITAWYALSGGSATREMDSVDLGTTVPASILAAFNGTKYKDTALWRIEEVELEHNYNTNGRDSYYEIELDGINANSKLEAELFFSSDPTGVLLYSKEELDDDDNDSDDDRFVINDQLKAAVETAAPGAQIIDAEIDDNLIEVEAIITTDNPPKEIELKFTMTYVLVSQETEFLYSQLPVKFDVIKTWFAGKPTPAPTTNPKVEITEGNQTETNHSIGNYYYEIEIDDYTVGGTEYEVEFYLNSSVAIMAVIVNDIKQ